MSESPFEQVVSNAGNGSTPFIASSGSRVELRPLLRALIPYVAVVSVPIVPSMMYFVAPPSLKLILSGLVLLLELSAFGFLWFVLNGHFVRADETGVAQSRMGKTKSVSWSDAASLEECERPGSTQTSYKIKNRQGETILEFSDFGNKTDGVKMRDFIAAKLVQTR